LRRARRALPWWEQEIFGREIDVSIESIRARSLVFRLLHQRINRQVAERTREVSK
jgi:hypothetical protein